MVAMISLEAHLKVNAKSEKVSLAYLGVGDPGIAVLAKFMKDNVHMHELDIRGCSINPECCMILMHSLRNNTTLHSIILARNQIGISRNSHQSPTMGMEAMRDILHFNEHLRTIDLRHNYLGANHIVPLVQLLKSNKSISHIMLSGNDLGAEAGELLDECLDYNMTLIDVQLSECGIGIECLRSIAEKLKRNLESCGAPSPPTKPTSARHDKKSKIYKAQENRPRCVLADDWKDAIRPAIMASADPTELDWLGQLQTHFENLDDYVENTFIRCKELEVDAAEKNSGDRETSLYNEIKNLEEILAEHQSQYRFHDREFHRLNDEAARLKATSKQYDADRTDMEYWERKNVERLKAAIQDRLKIKAELETELWRLLDVQQSLRDEETELGKFLSATKKDLDKAIERSQPDAVTQKTIDSAEFLSISE